MKWRSEWSNLCYARRTHDMAAPVEEVAVVGHFIADYAFTRGFLEMIGSKFEKKQI